MNSFVFPCKRVLCALLFLTGNLFCQENFWSPTAGPQGEQIKSLAVNSDDEVFAGSWISSGQIFRSTNAGQSWEQITNWFPQNFVWAFLFDQNQYAFACTNGGAGVYRSSDNGDTWEPANFGLTNEFVNDLAINEAGNIFAATDYGMFRSSDSGSSWSEINSGLPATNNIVTSIGVAHNGLIIIGTFGNGMNFPRKSGQ